MNDKILVAEISGKRAGTKKQRPTEKMSTVHDFVIISNDSNGYETDLPIINVPDDYREWYCDNIKSSENAWYAPMNRSYAIKYAKEHGYRYLVQLDDNIIFLEIAAYIQEGNVSKLFRSSHKDTQLDDYIRIFKAVIKNTNAGMVGCQLAGAGTPEWVFMKERYCYSIFMLDLERCPDVFQGDFEDDIEFRLKLRQMGYPVIQVPVLRYGKTSQAHNKDLTGCRAEYFKAGLKRGEHMTKLYGDVYSCRMSRKRMGVRTRNDAAAINFKHDLKAFKVGIMVKNIDEIKDTIIDVMEKYADCNTEKVLTYKRNLEKDGKR